MFIILVRQLMLFHLLRQINLVIIHFLAYHKAHMILK